MQCESVDAALTIVLFILLSCVESGPAQGCAASARKSH